MTRYFNTEGACRPEEHYMVKLDDRLNQIKTMLVDRKKYFVINKGRQYGKTTTLKALAKYLVTDYIVFSLDFQKMGTKTFADESAFSKGFLDKLLAALKRAEIEEKEMLQAMLSDFKNNNSNIVLDDLFEFLSSMCESSPRPIILMIDEVDSASNNQVFIDFLAQLRAYYLDREETPTFHSVILAGVYNIKNLKLKLRSESEHQYNSPWNIAADFEVDMSFSADQIADMLEEYEADHQTGMDIKEVAEELYQYTSGYPVLVSSICKKIDEKIYKFELFGDLSKAWTKAGIEEAVKYILIDQTPLFESMIRHLDDYPEMKQMFHSMLFQGNEFTYNLDVKEISLASMFGYAVNQSGKVRVANRIFETRLYNYFLSETELSGTDASKEIGNMAKRDRSYFIHDGMLDMDTVMRRFVETFTDIYGEENTKFIEEYGRKFFLLYLRPIINGTGNYYIEAQTRDERRTDIIVDYLGEQFIIELKIWRGNEYNERGERQLTDYLDYYHKDKGYLLSFNFNQKKEVGVKEIRIGDKTIVEAVV
ncbi:MAG: 9-O-acetyl-N-acetylneuraminate esterase [Lachnospiraceae bacterium]|nr:9-O-acetyl-N-acetylneuraminate esterase [Lachnospiraceae bacterium]